jgi:hypothetical protein
MTKEQLVKQNQEFNQKMNDLTNQLDSVKRRETKAKEDISKLFGFNDPCYGYNSNKSKILSWEEIYFELGKLVESKNQINIQEIYELISIAKDPEILVRLRTGKSPYGGVRQD